MISPGACVCYGTHDFVPAAAGTPHTLTHAHSRSHTLTHLLTRLSARFVDTYSIHFQHEQQAVSTPSPAVKWDDGAHASVMFCTALTGAIYFALTFSCRWPAASSHCTPAKSLGTFSQIKIARKRPIVICERSRFVSPPCPFPPAAPAPSLIASPPVPRPMPLFRGRLLCLG
jgi:hypothetical protein